MITEATHTDLSAGSFENFHAHVAHMVDSDDYIGKPGVAVNRYIMGRSIGLLDGTASIGGSPAENIPVLTATVEIDAGSYHARAFKYSKYSDVLQGETEVVRGGGEYMATITNPRAAVLVASLAAKAIERR